jgi:hypothetical protein
MRGMVVSMVGVWLVVGSVFMVLEIASKEPAGVSRREDRDNELTGEVGGLSTLSQH